MVDYPSILKVDKTNNDIENYYQVFGENTYYIAVKIQKQKP